MSSLDDLFKEKLEQHSVTPSPAAWQKIEAGLANEKRPVIWLRWAAVFLLGGLLAGTLWLREKDAAPVLTEKIKTPPAKSETPDQTVTNPAIEQTKTKQAVVRKKANPRKGQPPVQTVIAEEKLPQPIAENAVTPVKEKLDEAPVAETSTTVASTSIVLVYTLDPVENKKAEATTDELVASTPKKDNSLKRAMKFAQNVKNGDAPFGELRVMKEELFALDFKKKATTKKQ